MKTEQLNWLLDATIDGNHSELYKIVKHKLDAAGFDKLPAHYQYDTFSEFMLFEADYYRIKKVINSFNLEGSTIVDIGCQYGIQSELFLDCHYIGFDGRVLPHINQPHLNVEYLVEWFPKISIDLADQIVISNMSIGWGSDTKDYSAYFKDVKMLFISTNQQTITSLSRMFKYTAIISTGLYSKFDRHYFSNSLQYLELTVDLIKERYIKNKKEIENGNNK